MANTTSTGGAPKGNNNAGKNKPWADALRRAALRAIDNGDYRALDKAAEALLAKAADGDVSACKELGDRLDGKAVQPVEQKTELTGSLSHEVAVRPRLTKEEWLQAHGLGTATRPSE